ncbi:MAG: cation transporter [Oscillospiraceae bacterium]
MMKAFKIKNLDCANCAAKLEEEIRKVNGVNNVSIAFMTQKMMLDMETSDSDNIMREVKKAIRRTEPGCELIGL